MALTGEMYDAVIRIVDDRVKEIRVTREMYDRLTETVTDLAEAQKRTEQRVDSLTVAVQELAQAQKRTEQRLEELAEAQKRTEQRVDSLAASVQQLAEVVKATNQTVGRLTDTVGHDLESVARISAPAWLELYEGVKVSGLEKRVFKVDGEEYEVDLCGEGVRSGKPVQVLGEVKSTIHGRDVADFAAKASLITKQLKQPTVKLQFGYWIHPSAEAEAKRTGTLVIAPPSDYPAPRPTRKAVPRKH